MGVLFVAMVICSCRNTSVPSDDVNLTTPALEEIPRLRERGASKTEWEAVLGGRIESIASQERLLSILSMWELPPNELDLRASQFDQSNEVIYYGTDLDGRMVIFYDHEGQGIATWASWDPIEEFEEHDTVE